MENDLIPLNDNDYSEKILNELRGKKFFAIEINEDDTHIVHKNMISDKEIIYAAHLLINFIMMNKYD